MELKGVGVTKKGYISLLLICTEETLLLTFCDMNAGIGSVMGQSRHNKMKEGQTDLKIGIFFQSA